MAEDTNMEIWSKLGVTNPKHTKAFTRGGGFRGTAIKPIYTEEKMTEVFGPCGIGWGTSEPTFQLVPAGDEVLVFCWLTLWVVWNGKRSDPIPGVGGDKVLVKQSSGLRSDDEAFKKAATDATGNAMKHLGMSADVHMGLFDDSKYVREREEEERKAPQARTEAQGDAETTVPDSTAKLVFPALQSELRGCATAEQLRGAWERWLAVIVHWSDTMKQNCEDVRKEMADYLAEHAGDARSANREVIEADLRASVSEADLNTKWSSWGPAMKKLAGTDVAKLQAVAREVKAAANKPATAANPDFTNLQPNDIDHKIKVAQTP